MWAKKNLWKFWLPPAIIGKRHLKAIKHENFFVEIAQDLLGLCLFLWHYSIYSKFGLWGKKYLWTNWHFKNVEKKVEFFSICNRICQNGVLKINNFKIKERTSTIILSLHINFLQIVSDFKLFFFFCLV